MKIRICKQKVSRAAATSLAASLFASDLQLVIVLVEVGDALLETLALAAALNDLTGLRRNIKDVAGENLPVVKHALGEGLATGVRAEIGSEAERLVDGQESLDNVHGGTSNALLAEHVATPAVEHSVNATNGSLGALDLHEVNGLEDLGVGSEHRRVNHTAGRGDDLAASAVNGVGVESHVHDVEAASAHVLVAEHTLLGRPLEAGNARVLDLVEVLDSLGGVDEHVGASRLGAKAPDLAGLCDVPVVLVCEVASLDLGILLGGDGAAVNVLGETLLHGGGLHVNAVVLVGRLREAGNRRELGNSLAVRHDGVRLLEGNPGVVLLEILEANLEMELTGTSDNVLTRLLDRALHEGVRLGKALKTLDKLREISGVLALDGDTHDGRHRVLHDAHVVRILKGADRASLDKVLVDSDETANVATGHIFNGLDVAAHHENSALDGLDGKIRLGSGEVVGSHEAHLLASGDNSREDTSESVETALVRGGHHLRDVHHERCLGVARADTNGSLVVHGAFVEELAAVLLRRGGRREMDRNHLKERISGREPLAHNRLEQSLALLLLLLNSQLDAEDDEHLLNNVLLLLEDGIEQLVDGVEDELHETTDVAGTRGLRPLLLTGVIEGVAPEALHHALGVDLELVGVHLGEHLEGESPAVEAGAESDRAERGSNLDVAHGALLALSVGRNDDVDVLDNALEGLVEILHVKLELKESTVHLVHHEHGLDALTDGLAKHSLGLHAHTRNAVNDDESTVRHTEGSSHLRREVDVSWRVDEVDEESASIVSLRDEGHVLLLELEEEGDGGRLDGDAPLLLIRTRVHKAELSGAGLGNDACLADERVGQRRLSVVDVGNNRHVADVVLLVHEGPNFVDGKVHHFRDFLEELMGTGMRDEAAEQRIASEPLTWCIRKGPMYSALI
eukprot:Opistho-2@19439